MQTYNLLYIVTGKKDMSILQGLQSDIDKIMPYTPYGTVISVRGLLIEASGLDRLVSIGNQAYVYAKDTHKVLTEIVGFRDSRVQLMAYEALDGIGPGAKVEVVSESFVVAPSENWLGRVINGCGNPIDRGPELVSGSQLYKVYARPLPAHQRDRVGGRLDLGVKAVNTFTTCCSGQRMGIFAGSGVGKSVMLSQMVRFTSADVNVIGLIGERGREVQEFLQDYLGDEGLKRSVVIVATSDEPALMRRQAAYLTMCIAEYFRDNGKQVLCVMDSVTRFAMAMREIGLSIGEPPASKGYTPSVFSELPLLLERAGPGTHESGGSVTGLFTVLVEGDDTNEPISDAVRGILDGHIILDRSIAERNRFPAINVLKSISRMMPDCNPTEQTELINKAKDLLSSYTDMEELIRLGAYRQGSNKKVDEAIFYYEALENFISQNKHESCSMDESFEKLKHVFDGNGDR